MNNFLGFKVIPQLVYTRPSSLDNALGIMKKSSSWTLVAGGTDFIPAIRKGVWKYPDGVQVLDLRGLEDLQKITLEGEKVRIGATVRLAEILSSSLIQKHAPLLAQAVGEMASLQVRNSATIGGNLCTASPAADTAPPLLALDAEVELLDLDGQVKSMPLTDFFTGPGKCACSDGKILKCIRISVQKENEKTFRRKMGPRQAFTISIISMAMKAKIENNKIEEIAIAFGSVAPTPIRANKTEALLKGQEVSQGLVQKAMAQAMEEVSPISDIRASAEYRKDMAGVLTKQGLKTMLT